MIINSIIKSTNYHLRNINEKDDVTRYLNWIRDKKNNKFIASIDKYTTQESLNQYIESNNMSPDSILLGIFTIFQQKHIGNIRLSQINFEKKEAFLGILVGEISYRSKGVGHETITSIMDWAHEEFGIDTFKLGCDFLNKPALKLYKKLGFSIFKVKFKHGRLQLLMRKYLR